MVNSARKKEAAARDMIAKKKAVAKTAASAAKKQQQRGKKPVEQKEAGAKRSLGAMVDDVERDSVNIPAFRYDVHIVNSELSVEVTLHKANPNAINVEESTDKKLVIDTTKGGGRKFRLEFDFPEKMVCDSKKAEYEFEAGILRCKFPVTKMPKAMVENRAKFIEKVTADKKKRFKVREEQGLQIRSREAEMEMTKMADEMEANVVAPKELPAKKKKTEAEVDAEVAALQAAHKAGELAPQPKAEKPGVPTTSANPKKQFVGDEDALKMAVAAGQQVKHTLQQRLKLARELQKSRLERTHHREETKTTKQDKKAAAYERILNEKRSELAKKTQMLAKPEKKAPTSRNPKSVKFA